MSTAIPLTLIEGAMAMPRLRPLDRLPAPFGHDWALLPPHISMRAELKALYAAVLRTFCVNTAAFRSLCRWDARRSSAPASTPGDTLRTGAAPAGPNVPDAVQEATDFIASAALATGYRSPTRRAALAGGVCAVGGAAVLAWLAISHLSQYLTSVQAAHKRHAAPLATSAAPLKFALDAPKASSAVGDTNSSGLSEQRTFHTSQQSLLPNPSNTRPNRNGHAQAREPGRHAHGKPHRATPRAASKTQRSIHSLSARAETRIEAPAFTPRSVGTPSSAGGFSPFAPATLGVDEYASVRMTANTQLPNVAPARSQSHAINNDSADWMSHLSQRRVTDAPEQFAK